MGNTIVSGNRRTFRATLFGVAMLIFGGTALAASAPSVGPLYLTGTNGTPLTDANGNPIPYKVATGYEANRVAVDNNGNVYVADAVLGTVSIFNTNGRLVRQIELNRAFAVGVDKDGFIYAGGSLNGGIGIFVFDGNGKAKITLGRDWGRPSTIAFAYYNAGGIDYTDVYVADASLGLVRRKTLKASVNEGVLTKEEVIEKAKDYGPYDDKGYASKAVYNNLYLRYDTVYRMRQKMVFPQAIAVDKVNGLLYIGISEVMETLKDTCNTVSSTATGDSSTSSGSALNCYDDTKESYKYYENLCPDGSCTGGIQTTAAYNKWNPMDVSVYPSTVKYHVLIIDIKEKLSDGSDNPAYGTIKRDMLVAAGDDPTYGDKSRSGSERYAFIPTGLSLDGKGRLYVAGMGCDGLGLTGTTNCTNSPGKVKVYNVDVDLTQAAPNLVFDTLYGWYTDVVFSPDKDGAPEGRLFATIGDSKTVASYSIDGGTNPANTGPTAPVLYDPDPANSNAVVATKKPTLKIVNARDDQNDPLTYAYEVYEINKNRVRIGDSITPPSMFAEEKANVGTEVNPIYTTSMAISSDLKENSLYSWRARSFDGELGTWNAIEGVFCVDAENENPTEPVIQKPLDGAAAPPLTTYLEWSRSEDPDCYGTVSYYTIEISGDAAFRTILFSSGVGNSLSIRLSDIKGLTNGTVYYWRVKASDANGGVSYSAHSSFVYNYKTGTAGFGSNQPGTKVYIDGNYGYYGRFLGETPMEDVGGIAVGRHFVTFIKDGHEPFYAITDVKDPAQGTTEPIMAAMVAASRIKPPAEGGTIKDSSGADIATAAGSVPFVVDYNNDGVKDVLVGGGDGKVYRYLSEAADGSIVPLRFKGAVQAYDSVTETSSDINVASNAVPFVVDYNNDGRKDLLIGSSDGSTYLCLNIGEDSAPVFASSVALQDKDGSDIKAISNSAPAVVDYNNDGKKDLVVGSSDGKLRLYSNTGSDESPVFGVSEAIKADGSDLNVGSNSKAFFTDWNSDGKKDLVVGDSSGKASLFFNIGTDDAPEFKSIPSLQQWIKEKKKERGNREFVPYLGYNQDLGDLAGGSGEVSPFVVDWYGSSARDVMVGNGSGGVAVYITE